MTQLANRRNVLRTLGAVAASLSFGQAGAREAGPPAPQSPTELLNFLTTAEALAVTFYHHALSGAQFRVDPEAREHLGQVLSAEQRHLETLRSLGGRPLVTSFQLPEDLCADARQFAQTGLELETAFAEHYVGAARQFARLGHPDLAATAAHLGASEAQHLGLLSHLAGLGLRELAWPAEESASKQAFAVLSPYLSGGRLPLPDAAAVRSASALG